MSKFDEFYSKNYGSNENNRRSQLERWESARKAREEEEEKRRQQEEKKRQQEEEKRRQESKRNVEIPKAGASLPVSIARIGSEKQQKDRAVIDSAAKSKTANLPDSRYNATVNSIRKGTQSDSVKNGYLAEAQIQREVDLLEAKAKEERTAPNKNNLFILSPAAQQNHFQKTETEKLLDEKKEELKSVKAQNKGNRINDIVDSGKYDAELEAMLAHDGEEDFINKYKGDLALTGYDAEEVYNLYKQKKTDERLNTALADPSVNELVGKIHAYERAQEERALTQLMNPNAASSGANASTYAQLYVDADSARKQLAEMGYEPEELVVRYGRNLNQQSSEGLRAEATKLGEEHPVLGTAATFPLMAASGMGLAEVAKAKLTGREVDPNSPYFAPLTMAQTTRDEVSSDMGTVGKIGYGAATSIGDMLVSRLAPGGAAGYSIAMASQAAASTAQQGAEKGYSTDHIIMNAAASAALTAACEKIGFDKVFKPQNASTVTDVAKNIAKGFLAEGGEEASEEVLNTFAQNITSKLYTNQTEIERRVGELTSQGMSEDDAVTTAMVEIGEQVGTSFVVGGLSGGAMAGANSMPSYIVNRPNAKNSVEPQQSVSDTENVENLPSQPQVATQNETVVPQTEEAKAQPNTAQNADFEEVDDGDVSWEDTETDDEYSEYLAGFEQYVREYDNLAADPTPEKVSVVDQDIKADYDSENYDGVTEDKVEPYTSGNPAVDAAVNPDGRLDRVITTDEQAEQNLIDKAQKMFGRKVRFVDTLDDANALFDRDSNEIVIARDSQIKSLSAFGHEFAHTLEGTLEYSELKTHLQQNSLYIKNKLAEVGNNWDKLVNYKITQYQNALGKTLSTAEAEYEIIADAIGEELFTNYEAMESLATQNRSIFTRLKQWFTENFISIRETRKEISNPKAAARKTYALMLRAEKAAMNRTQGGEGVAYSTKNGTDTKKPLETVNTKRYNKSTKYDEYNSLVYQWSYSTSTQPGDMRIFNNKGKDFRLLQAIGDGSYVEMAKGSFEKVASIYDEARREIDEYRETVYESANRYEDERRRNSWSSIDDKKRESNGQNSQRFEGEGFPDNTTGDDEYNLSSNNRTDVSYSAKKSDTVQRITENFGYSDATANSIYKAARTLRQNTASKADADELAYTIATTLENRRNGNTDPSDAERIAMMIAEDAKALNEDFITENKPILDRLNGTKISISEADISDLGDAFSYVKGKLFPYVTLTKGEGISVDSLFQDLAEEFPFAFDADAVTHPADQVKAIMGFVEDYRNNKYYKPYFEDSEAFDYLRTEVENMLNDTNVDEASYLNKLEQLVERYGELKNGVPKSTDGKTKVRRTAASFYGSKPVIENPELAERFAKEIVNGKYDYDVMRQGKLATQYLNQIKSSDNVAEKVVNEYERIKSLLTNPDHKVTPTDVLQAVALNPLLGEVLSADDFVNYTMLVSEVGTSAGQIISSLRLINQFSPVHILKAVQKNIDRINEKQSRHYEGEIETNAVADENGQFISEGAPQTSKGVMEFVATKHKTKYPPIKIPAELEQKLLMSKTKEETQAATDEIMQYIENQIHYSWFDKLSSFRYLAMLLNPKTVIKNTLGNASMSAVARGKDVVAAGLSKIPIAKKYQDSSTQTTSVLTSKDARKAALTLLGDSRGVVSLFSGQDKYTGKESLSSKSDAKLNKVEKKLAEKNPLIEVMLNNRSIQSTPLANSKVPIVGKVFEKISDFQQKTLDDTPFKILRAKTVLAQSITAAVKSGDIKSIDDFVSVALNQNAEHLDNATKIKYAQLYDKFCKQAATEGDEATFRENNMLADKINKLRQGKTIKDKLLTVLIDGAIPFVKTPANVAKRSLEYSPLGLAKAATADRYKLATGEIDRNTYINNLAKGLTGTSIFALGALLSAFDIISADDGGDEEEKAKKQLLGGQDYAINIGEGSYTIDFLSPTSVPLFMGAKVYDEIVKAMNGDDIKALDALFEVMMGVTGPLFAQTMLSGVDGALESVSRETAYGENEEGRSMIALVNYCAESWISQFVPTILGAAARTGDDTVRTYGGSNNSAILGGLKYGVQKKVPGANQKLPAKLDMWGQPVKSGSLPERLIENFISPGYWEEDNSDKATQAIKKFAEENGIAYSDIIPKAPSKNQEVTLPDRTKTSLSPEEYAIYAGEIGAARKKAVEDYLVNNKPIEFEITVYSLKEENQNGLTSAGGKKMYRGVLNDAKNTVGWFPKDAEQGFVVYGNDGKAEQIKAADDETFRRELYRLMWEAATEEGKSKAIEKIVKNRKNAKE